MVHKKYAAPKISPNVAMIAKLSCTRPLWAFDLKAPRNIITSPMKPEKAGKPIDPKKAISTVTK
jgi:hypothetical protein